MYEFTEPVRESKEENEARQMLEWLAGSHFWEKRNGTMVCRWCERITTTSLSGDAHLCPKNPAIVNL